MAGTKAGRIARGFLQDGVHGVSKVKLVLRIVALNSRSQQDRAERDRWAQLAVLDPLTGLLNRRGWDVELQRIARGQPSVCVTLLDVDFFKRVNDAEGHQVGDLVLREVAICLRSSVKPVDVVARVGGDEFGLILVDVEGPGADEMLDSLRGNVLRHLTELELPSPTLSAGYATSSMISMRTPGAFYQAACDSLRRAKQLERNRTVAYVDV